MTALSLNFELPETAIFNYSDYRDKILAIKNNNLNPMYKMILVHLASRFGKDGRIFPSDRILAECLGISKASVAPYLSRLKSLGYIEIKRKSKSDPRSIKLIDPQSGQQLIPKLSINKIKIVDQQKDTYIYKQETITGNNNSKHPPDPPPNPIDQKPHVVSFESKKTASELRDKIITGIRKRIGISLIERLLSKYNQSQIEQIIDTVNRRTDIKNPAAYLAKAATGHKWDIDDKTKNIEEDRQRLVKEMELTASAKELAKEKIEFTTETGIKERYLKLPPKERESLFLEYVRTAKSKRIQIKWLRLGPDNIINKPMFQCWLEKKD